MLDGMCRFTSTRPWRIMLVMDTRPAEMTSKTNLSWRKFMSFDRTQRPFPKKWQYKISLKNNQIKINMHKNPANPASVKNCSQSLSGCLKIKSALKDLYMENILPKLPSPTPNKGKSLNILKTSLYISSLFEKASGALENLSISMPLSNKNIKTDAIKTAGAR